VDRSEVAAEPLVDLLAGQTEVADRVPVGRNSGPPRASRRSPGRAARLHARIASAAAPLSASPKYPRTDSTVPTGSATKSSYPTSQILAGFRWPYTSEPDTQPLADKIGALNAFADKVIAKVKD